MALTVSCKRLPDQMDGGEDEHGRRTYKEVFEIDQTDGGSLAAPVAVVIKAQSSNSGPDVVPLRGDNYSYAGTTDLDSYAMRFSWKRPKETDLKTRIHATVDYGPADGFNPGRLAEPNPLLWPTEYWLEWTEEQVPVKNAKNVQELVATSRAAGTSGPIVNAAGEEPVDPVIKVVRYPILCAQKAYATLNEIVALNTTYQDTTNNDTYFGATARKAKYLSTESGHITRTQGYSVYLGVTKIWFKNLTWDLKILNIGFNRLLADGGAGGYKLDGNGKPQRYRCSVRDTSINSSTGAPQEGNWVPSSEPLKLTINGLQADPSQAAIYIDYRDLNEVAYLGIGIGS